MRALHGYVLGIMMAVILFIHSPKFIGIPGVSGMVPEPVIDMVNSNNKLFSSWFWLGSWTDFLMSLDCQAMNK